MSTKFVLGLGGTVDYEIRWDADGARAARRASTGSGRTDLDLDAPVDSRARPGAEPCSRSSATVSGESASSPPPTSSRPFAARFAKRGHPRRDVRAGGDRDGRAGRRRARCTWSASTTRCAGCCPASVDYVSQRRRGHARPAPDRAVPGGARVRVGDIELGGAAPEPADLRQRPAAPRAADRRRPARRAAHGGRLPDLVVQRDPGPGHARVPAGAALRDAHAACSRRTRWSSSRTPGTTCRR